MKIGGGVGDSNWPAIAVVGAGAVGCTFGGLLARAGAPVTFIGRPRHIEPIKLHGLDFESLQFRERLRVAATTEAGGASAADLVLLCVKTLDTEAAAKALAPHLTKNAAVVSLQNGVDNVERIRAASGIEAIPAVVYVAAEMVGPGHVKHTARGDLIIGRWPAHGPPDAERLETVSAVCARAGIPCPISENIEGELWLKLLLNCACNAISALGRTRYGPMARNPHTRELMKLVAAETMHVARKAGVRLPAVDPVAAVWKLVESMPETISSTAQDIARGKLTEIDSLNGYVARRGLELGIATPVNQTLHALVKLLEEGGEPANVARR
jgi:2-dehydropantoate 2-reductase